VITLSVVIRGKTKHFDQVVLQTAKGVREVSQKTGVPVILGMIPANSVEDAVRRVGIKQTSKGREWALSAIEMASLLRKLDAKKS
jgi:6,7-dimethyl-8-ribityllumazine synthase